PRALRMELNGGGVTMDDMGSLAVSNATARLHYQVESELELPLGTSTPSSSAGAVLSQAARNRFLQLPALSPGIARLAREVTAGSRSPWEAAARLNRHLSTSFRYTLAKP